jgi:3,8-divinyl chlorophyllide a/chlorophyllide a reductase subunit X
MMAQQGKKVLLIGCDPKSDTTSLLFGGRACPTIIETSSKKKLAGEPSRSATSASSATACSRWSSAARRSVAAAADAASSTASRLLEKLGFHDWGFDYVLLDFLGDVVCGGFGLPIARDMCQKVIVVGSNDLQSLYVANNVCSAVEYFRKLGGNVGVAGIVINKDDGTGEAQAFAEAVGIPVLAAIPATRRSAARAPTTRSSASPGGSGAAVRANSRQNVADAPPVRPKPLTQDGCSACSRARRSAATWCSSRRRWKTCAARSQVEKPTLEVVYDTV